MENRTLAGLLTFCEFLKIKTALALLNVIFENNVPKGVWVNCEEFTKWVVEGVFSILTGSHSLSVEISFFGTSHESRVLYVPKRFLGSAI